jgi:hypothetical protein
MAPRSSFGLTKIGGSARATVPGSAPGSRRSGIGPSTGRERDGFGMVALRLAALWLGLIAPASVPQAREAGGEVIVDALEVLDEADESGYASGELKRGTRVSVAPGGRPGWLAIAPPDDAFNWVDASSIKIGADGRGEVVGARAPVRSGAAGAKMPGPPRPPLAKGAVVLLLDRPALTVGEGAKARSWRAIAPAEGEIRYVRSDGVRLDPVATKLASTAPLKTADPQVMPAQKVTSGGDAEAAIRKFEEALQRSRRLDHEVAQIKQKLADARTTTERSYDAKGLLQASSRQVEGQKVHALIGPEGVPIAYLTIPPGIPAGRLLARKVGVRGDVHFNESLGTRLITVRDLDPLDKPR